MKTNFILEQGSGRANEDAISVNGSMFGVFDGATSLDSRLYENGKTGGYLAADTAKKIFSENSGALVHLAEKANRAIYHKMLENNVTVSDKNALWSTSAAVVRISNNKLEWFQIGDSLILLIYNDGTFHIPVSDYDHDSETLLMWKAIAQNTDAPVIEALKEQIRDVRSKMNIDYGVLNGESAYSHFVRKGREDLHNLSHVILFTDGLFIPSEDPQKTEFDTFVHLFHKGGLPEIRDHVRLMEKTDPLCKIYPRFKPHDDIAAIALTF